MNDTVTQVCERQDYLLTALFPSTSNPKSVKDAVFLYNDCLVKDEKKIDTSQLIEFYWHSTIRVYKVGLLGYIMVYLSVNSSYSDRVLDQVLGDEQGLGSRYIHPVYLLVGPAEDPSEARLVCP